MSRADIVIRPSSVAVRMAKEKPLEAASTGVKMGKYIKMVGLLNSCVYKTSPMLSSQLNFRKAPYSVTSWLRVGTLS